MSSLKDVLMHLAIVTTGILIALSLEGLLEWRHHRNLAQEARENIRSELRDNKLAVDELIKEAPALRKQQEKAMTVVIAAIAHQKHEQSMTIGWRLKALSDSSWRTAQSVGALSFMSYGEVKKYTPVYTLQSEVLREQQATLDASTVATAIFASGNGPDTMSNAELVTERSRLEVSIGAINTEMQLAEALSKEYDEVLSGK